MALTDPESELATVIVEDAVGWFVPPHNSEKLLEQILEIYNERAISAELGSNSLDYGSLLN